MPLLRARRSLERIRSLATGARVEAPRLSIDAAVAKDLFVSQLLCRVTDVEAHELRARNQGYYTICSAGHEGNVALGALTRATDPALLHYRSGAFFLARAVSSGAKRDEAVLSLLLSLAASADDPISGGRHKVFGSVPWGIPPQTSTISSHLPKAVGMALAIDRMKKLGFDGTKSIGAIPTARDSIVLCSFGDASLNHSTAQGAINAASWAAYQKVPVPVIFVCEDNGIGVSVRTPNGWVEARMKAMPAMEYVYADGRDLGGAYTKTKQAVDFCRERRRPVFLHLATERVWGHAGSDADGEYRNKEDIARAEDNDPVLVTAQTLLDAGVLTGAELVSAVDKALAQVTALSAETVTRPKLTTRAAVMDSIAPHRQVEVLAEAKRTGYADMPADTKAKPLGHCIRAGLNDLMRKYGEMIMFGEDVAEKGGVYGVTVGLWKQFGPGRVFNTLLDEQTILGVAIGAGQVGLLPVPEIQFLAYLHNAEDQLRGEAATLSFFSRAQLKNPMVVRIAGLGYQKGFGGHFHNDDSLAVLRDIPGIIVACPSRGDDAVKMMRTLVAAAKVDGRVAVIVEPIALYHTKDLHAAGDSAWMFPVPPQGEAIDIGEVGVYAPEARDLVIFTYGNGVPMSLRVSKKLAEQNVQATVVDLRWIAPLPAEAIETYAREAAAVLVVDECRRSGNVGEAIAALIAENPALHKKPFARVASADSFIPLADAANLVLMQEDEILHAALAVTGTKTHASATITTIAQPS